MFVPPSSFLPPPPPPFFTTSSLSYSSLFVLIHHPFGERLRRQAGNFLLTVHTRAPDAVGATYKVDKGRGGSRDGEGVGGGVEKDSNTLFH